MVNIIAIVIRRTRFEHNTCMTEYYFDTLFTWFHIRFVEY